MRNEALAFPYFQDMKTLTIELPENLSTQAEHDLKMELAGVVYAKGLISANEAAALAGISRSQFLETIGHYRISLVGNSIEHLSEEVANARRYL